MVLDFLCGWRSAQKAENPGSTASGGEFNNCEVVTIFARRYISNRSSAVPSEEVARLSTFSMCSSDLDLCLSLAEM